jgi:hypothetical protein
VDQQLSDSVTRCLEIDEGCVIRNEQNKCNIGNKQLALHEISLNVVSFHTSGKTNEPIARLTSTAVR